MRSKQGLLLLWNQKVLMCRNIILYSFCVSLVLQVFLIKVFSIAYKTQSKPSSRPDRFIKYIAAGEESDLKLNCIWEEKLHFSEEF